MTGEQASERCRLFVAIPVPDTVRAELLRVQSELQLLVPRGTVRWTNPEQFHLTLRFLGDVPFEHVAGLQASLRAVCAGIHPLHLLAQGVGFFPNARSPRVIWVGIHDRENRLLILQQKVESAV
jgi:RNA 2',3'-cyclic 3'-phosphodiesterase